MKNPSRPSTLLLPLLASALLGGCATRPPRQVGPPGQVTMPPPAPSQIIPLPTPAPAPVVKPLPPPIPTRTPGTHVVTPAPLSRGESRPYTIKSGENLSTIALRHNLSTRELADFNRIADPNRIRVGQTLLIPVRGGVAPAPVAPAPSAPSAPSAPRTAVAGSYVVQSGDSLWLIARRNGTTMAALRAENNLSSDQVRVGQTLRIPGGGAAPAAPVAAPAIETMPAAPRATPAPAPAEVAPLLPPPAAPTPPIPPAATATPDPVAAGKAFPIVVEPGETLEDIARSYLFTVEDIRKLNNLPAGAQVKPGDTLLIPPSSY